VKEDNLPGGAFMAKNNKKVSLKPERNDSSVRARQSTSAFSSKSAGRLGSTRITRRQFLKTAGVGAAAFGAIAVGGMGRTVRAAPIIEKPDSNGSLISVMKLDLDKTYIGVPDLLQIYIQNEYLLLNNKIAGEQERVAKKAMEDAWQEIEEKIDYTYEHMQQLFKNIWDENPAAKRRIINDVKCRKKLVIKPNWVTPLEDIDPSTWGPGAGWGGSTAWCFIAALLRYFHDKLEIPYSMMALAEGGDKHEFDVAFLNKLGLPITDLAIYEGRAVDAQGKPYWYGGIGMYFARKYLAGRHPDDHDDDPMLGYIESLTGSYVPPGKANGLFLYNLNRVNEGNVANGRARLVDVPDHGYRDYEKLWIHKVLVGDGTPEYPGAIIINAAKLKIHPLGNVTLCLKNMFGVTPQWAGADNDISTPDYLYSIPAPYPGQAAREHAGLPPCNKGGIPHDPHYGPLDANLVPVLRKGRKRGRKYELYFEGPEGTRNGPNNCHGIEGIIWDTYIALKNLGIYTLNVIDGIIGANSWHEASGPVGLVVEPTLEGLMIASEDPVAIGKFCYRYLFKKVPLDQARALKQGSGFKTTFLDIALIPKLVNGNLETYTDFDETTQIPEFDLRHAVAAEIGLGNLTYHVKGQDVMGGGKLVSVEGHFGKIKAKTFQDIITPYRYITIMPAYSMQKSTLAYMKAGDELTKTAVGYHVPLVETYPTCEACINAWDYDRDGVIDTLSMAPNNASRGWLGALVHSTRVVWLKEQDYMDGILKGIFRVIVHMTRSLNPSWNADGHYWLDSFSVNNATLVGIQMASTPAPPGGLEDPFFGNKWGSWTDHDGTAHMCWPSPHYALWVSNMSSLFGPDIADGTISEESAYGMAWQYAVKKTEASYKSIAEYFGALKEGATLLPFVFHLPPEYVLLDAHGAPLIPHTAVGSSPGQMFKAIFDSPINEVWPDSCEFPQLQ